MTVEKVEQTRAATPNPGKMIGNTNCGNANAIHSDIIHCWTKLTETDKIFVFGMQYIRHSAYK